MVVNLIVVLLKAMLVPKVTHKLSLGAFEKNTDNNFNTCTDIRIIMLEMKICVVL